MELKTIDYEALGLDIFGISGTEEIIVRCPYHDDHHPSASFNINKGLFFCFACGASANAYQLARKTGGTVIRNDKLPKKMFATVSEPEWEKFFDAPLAVDNEYLEKRGVIDIQVITFSIRELPWGIGFPIFSVGPGVQKRGILIRRYDDNPRYLFFGHKPSYFAGQNWDSRSTTIVEGVFGLLAADRAQVTACCLLGTSVRADLIPPFRQLGDRLQCLFDDDFPGYLAAAKFLHMSPLAKAIIPGQEADELTIGDWQAIDQQQILRTSDISKLRRFSKDPIRFDRLFKSFRKRTDE